MSAFLCSDRHIGSLALTYGSLLGLDDVAIQGIANDLKRENIRSVNYRYKERSRIKPCDMSHAHQLNQRDAMSLRDSLEYQSCERPDAVRVILSDMKTIFINRPHLFKLPPSVVGSPWTI